MAFAPTNIKNARTIRGGSQKDTTGQLYTKTFTFTVPAGTANAAAELTGIVLPANLYVLACLVGGSVASTDANCTLALSSTTGSKTFGAATAITASNATVQFVASTVTAPLATLANESTVTATWGANTQSTATDVTVTIAGFVVGAAGSTYSTFTG
jgi:hypothetical protein